MIKYKIKKVIYPALETTEDSWWRQEYKIHREDYAYMTDEEINQPAENIAFVLDFGAFEITATFSLFTKTECPSIIANTPSFGFSGEKDGYGEKLRSHIVFKDLDEYVKFARRIRKRAEKVTGIVFSEMFSIG